MEILTNILTDEQFRHEVVDVMTFLSHRGIKQVAIAFAFTPDAPDLDDAGVRKPVAITDVPSVIAERERTKGFHLGAYDCWIEASGLDARFQFCNDRDVHFTSESAELLECVRARWRASGFRVYPDDFKKA